MLKSLVFTSLVLLNGCFISQRGGLSQDVGQLLSQSDIKFWGMGNREWAMGGEM